MAYKGFRPDLMMRVTGAFHSWPSYNVTVREIALHLGGQNWTQIEECFQQLVKEGKLGVHHWNTGQGVDFQYRINDHIVPWRSNGKGSSYQAHCPRCNRPIQGRHGRRNRQHHDDDKCDFDTTKLLIEE